MEQCLLFLIVAATETATATAFTRDEYTAARSNAANSANADDVGDAATAKALAIMSQEALTALTDLTFHYATTLLANDLASFCQHAHRKTVKVDDVLLAVRKDGDGIGADLQRFSKRNGISSSDGHDRDHRVRRGRSGHRRSDLSHFQNQGGESATTDSRRHRSLLAMKNHNGSGSDGVSISSSNSDGSVEELIYLTPERRRRLRLKEQRELQQRHTLLPKPTVSEAGKKKSTTSTAKSNSKASGMNAKGKLTTSKNSQYRRSHNRRSGGEYCGSSGGGSSSSDDVEFQVDWTTTKTTAGGDTSSSAKGKNKNEKRQLFLDDSSDDDNDDVNGNDVHDQNHESMVVNDAGYGKHFDDNIAPKLGNKSNHGQETNKDDSNSDDDVLLACRSSSNSRRKKPNSNNDATRKKMASSSHDNENSVRTAKQSKATSLSTNTGLSKKRMSDTNTTSRRHSTDGGDLIDTDDDNNCNNLDAGNGRKGEKNLDDNGNDGDNADSFKLNATVSTLKRDSFSADSASASFAGNEGMVIDLADDDDDEE
mmetsp:Transcript_20576/g.43023  ORF Transcript_20576/g.43023 Transcript_20576/m.43023 type:complete len:538 (-) Transcript_20576:91-1704(-)